MPDTTLHAQRRKRFMDQLDGGAALIPTHPERIRSRDTRLAVMFATAPLSKQIRAFAMSTNGVSTGTPTADTDDTEPPTNVRTRSMS